MTSAETTSGSLSSAITVHEPKKPRHFVSEDELRIATKALTEAANKHKGPRTFRHRVELSPGSVRIAGEGKRRQKGEEHPKRSAIAAWTPKSRASMVARLASLDYRPLLGDPRLTVGMITLTYPGDWEAVAPDGATAKRHLRAFKKRYQRRFERELIGCWKMEFQRRGAVHFHIFTAVPLADDFLEWLSETWTDVVAPADPKERARHLLAGTNFEREPGLNYVDANRVAVYFTKHGSAGNGPKEYQNKPPLLWQQAGSVGRFWGYWGLSPLILPVGITESDAVYLGRVLRRWARANAHVRRVAVWRTKQKTGAVRRRSVRRRVVRMRSGRGFLTLPDGSAMGLILAKALASRDGDPSAATVRSAHADHSATP